MQKKDYYEFEVRDEIPELSPEKKEIERNLLCENIDHIINNSDMIINNEKYFYTKTSMTFIGSSISGVKVLYMGVLSQLWKDKKFIEKCDDCGERVYILGAGGSPLSGAHQYWACCSKCKEIKYGRKNSFSHLWKPAYDLSKKYSNKTVMRRYNLKSKQWYNILKEKRRPDKIISEKKTGLDITALIKELQNLQ